ncbi:ankyrin repeat domain-containing protein [Cocleimonas sp. KMM 6892]|uniref:ankyrin repeat domain-containing protein n=1 Tax=unclassified Cocleimonas TaxID=2639732 RepID=UPI002DB75A54|nr:MULTISPECIES: ankyrin repeat domain-containing protein [unclassified Cocleimonas]MEB8432958.1 ankyrin repeat domain-containing protein [Cocleimonas sp. KMM 6892]MEC4716061.1 ankyrin repeat domain-containing protein [Cocleimonas sp. KMM 6895]MEC4745522.1 ankyrin repeat domain-containing protein [Cocleimonas sp. KMM 6896]
MKYWFDKSATKNNIVILTSKALVVASADEASQDNVETQLKANSHPKTIFGPKGFKVISFVAIKDLKSISVDGNLEISYQTPKKLITENISFDSAKSKLECMGYIKKLTLKNDASSESNKSSEVKSTPEASPERDKDGIPTSTAFTVKTNKEVKKKPRFNINFQPLILPLISLAMAIGAAFLLYPKLNVIAYALGGIWALASLFFLYLGFKKPSEDDETYVEPAKDDEANQSALAKLSEKIFSVLKPAYVLGLAAIAVGALYFVIPDELRGPSSLYQAVQTRLTSGADGSSIQSYLDKGADINYMAEDGSTPLITALNFSEENLAIELINRGAALSTQFVGQTPLDLAIEASLDKAVKSMLNKEMVTSNPQDLLIRGISSGLNYENLKIIADSGMDMNHMDEEGLTALGIALLFGAEPKVVKLLLDRGASIDIKVGDITPLEFAKLRGYTEITAMLEQHSS